MIDTPHHGLLARGAVWSSWAVAAWIMLTLGWRAIRPDDPLGPVSLLAVSGWFGVALKTSLLAWAVALVG